MTEKPEDRGECALWHRGGWRICATEEEAARAALGIEDADGWTDGVQFADGTLQDTSWRTIWPMYEWASEQVECEREERAAAAPPPQPPIRRVRNPFTGDEHGIWQWNLDQARPWLGSATPPAVD